MGSSQPLGEDYPDLSTFTVTKRDPILPCHLIPFPRNKDFFNRERIKDRLEDSLIPSLGPRSAIVRQIGDDSSGANKEKSLKTFALCGAGGLGKTQVALEFAHAHTDVYDAIFWIHCDSYAKLEESFNRVAIELGLVLEESSEARDQVVTRNMVRGWLAKPLKSYRRLEKGDPQEAKWLLIFDNADDPNLLTDFWPVDGSVGSVIITSRDPVAKTKFSAIGFAADMLPFSVEEGAEYLLRLTWREDDPKEQEFSEQVVRRLAGLPLALTQMAGAIVRRDISFEEFLKNLEKEPMKRELFKSGMDYVSRYTAYPYTLATVWSLKDLEYSSDLLDILALLDSDGVPELLLTQKIESSSLLEFQVSEEAYEKARTELLELSLVSRDRSGKRLVLHRTLQDVVQMKMTDERFSFMFGVTVKLASNSWSYIGLDRHRVAKWKRCEIVFPHVVQLKHIFKTVVTPRRLKIDAELVLARLLNDAGW